MVFQRFQRLLGEKQQTLRGGQCPTTQQRLQLVLDCSKKTWITSKWSRIKWHSHSSTNNGSFTHSFYTFVSIKENTSGDTDVASTCNSIYCAYFAPVLLPDQVVATRTRRVQCLTMFDTIAMETEDLPSFRFTEDALTLQLGRSSNV